MFYRFYYFLFFTSTTTLSRAMKILLPKKRAKQFDNMGLIGGSFALDTKFKRGIIPRDFEPCYNCYGTGYIPCRYCFNEGCKHCKNTTLEECSFCGGLGEIEMSEQFRSL